MLPKPGSLNTEPGEVPLLPGALVPPGPSKAWQLWFGGPVPFGLEAAIALAALPRPRRPVRTSVVTIRRIRPPMGCCAWGHVSPRSCPLLRVDAQNRSACRPGRSGHYSIWPVSGSTPRVRCPVPVPRSEGHDSRAFLPFGAGPRYCPGRNLAMLEATMVAALLVRNFEITRPPSAPAVGE